MSQSALMDQSELAQALFEESGDALFLLNPETDQLVDVNPVALRMTGFTREEVMRFPSAGLFRFEAAGGMQRLRGAFSQTTVFHGQDGFHLRTKDNAWVPVNLSVSRLHLASRTLGLIVARDDRDRRQALAQARRVESELRAVLSSSPAALWSAERAAGPDDMAGWQFRYVSPLLARIAGRLPNSIDHPLKWIEVVYPTDLAEYRAWFGRLLADPGAEEERQYRILGADGSVRWVRDRLQVLRDAAGRPFRIDGCLVDITEQRQAEEAVRQNEQRFRALVEKSRDGILLVDENCRICYATPAIREVIGYDPAEVIGRIGFEFIYPDDVAGAQEQFAVTLAHPGEDIAHSFRILAANGAVRTIELNGCNRLADPNVNAVVVNYRDVTEREAATREITRQHALLEGLFASVPDIVFYKDRELRFLGGNRAFENLAGRPVTEVAGRLCDDVFPQGWADQLREIEAGVLASGSTARWKQWVAYPGGRQALLDFLVSPLAGTAHEPAGLIITGRDVTEQTRLEEQVRQSQKLEAVGRLAGGIAHDFNNLLTVILGNLELVCGSTSSSESRALLATTEQAARQAADLTRQILGYARPEQPRTVPVNLVELTRDTIALLSRTIDPRIVIKFTPPAGLPPVAADPVQLQQVLMNLCLNARDAMAEGGTLTIDLAPSAGIQLRGSDPDAGLVRLRVMDTGVGMTEEVQARIFEPFFTTKGIGQGTGLGLAMVYAIARAHGGWVECSSAAGAGSRFDVYLPQGTASREVRAEPTDAVVTRRGNGEVVLLADDEPLIRTVARTALERSGYRVLVAADGQEAVEVFLRESGKVDLVVLDVGMPRLSGPEAFREIRRSAPASRVLFASGHELADICGNDPATAFLHKPYTPSSLTAAVGMLLDCP